VRGRMVAAVAIVALTNVGSAQARPNIVFIVTDDQRWDTVSAMPQVTESLVGHGVTFSNGFVVNSLCCPSRASILTGRYSHSTRVYDTTPPLGGFVSFDDRSTVATWLHRAGYRTALVGKYLNGYVGRRSRYVPPGWDRWFAMSFNLQRLGYYGYKLNIDGHLDAQVRDVYSTDLLASAAVRFIRRAPSPFFLYFAPFAPHPPATPAVRHEDAFPNLEPWRPPSYNEADVSDKPGWLSSYPLPPEGASDDLRGDQLRSLLAVDEAVGRVLDVLAVTGRLRNTVIVFTSDNGYMWLEHRLVGKTYPYEESIRVPFIVRYDRLVSGPRVDPRLVVNIDFAPTFADLAGIPAPGAEGRSLVPLFSGAPAPWRRQFLVEHLRKTGSGGLVPTYCALRTEDRAFVVYQTGERELYDLVQDPYQLQNLAADPAWAPTMTALRPSLSRLCNPPPPGLSRRHLCTHLGTPGPDVIEGSIHYDVICAQGGDDAILPRGATDWVFAGAGNDRVYSRDGRRDYIFCGDGLDRVVADRIDRVAASCERVLRG
jgi:N-acetylglucosamine-6-sulfatase